MGTPTVQWSHYLLLTQILNLIWYKTVLIFCHSGFVKIWRTTYKRL